jgi:ketosteroid isomerase-like protein
MSAEENIATLRNIYGAYGRKDPGPFFDAVSEELQLRIMAHPNHFTFGGLHKGKAGLQRAIARIAEHYDWLKFEARDFIAEGDRVVALTGGVVKHRATGKRMKLDLVDVVQFRDGRIAAFTEFFDTAYVLASHGAAKVKAAKKVKASVRAKTAKKKPKTRRR